MLIIALAAVAIVTVVIFRLRAGNQKAADTLAIYVNGALYQTAPIRPGQDITVTQEDGSVNVIRMVEGGFFMQSSTCHNQDCIQQGAVTRDNWANRVLGTHVICLPNRVDVTLVVQSIDTEAPDA